jgi:hypothetical protein
MRTKVSRHVFAFEVSTLFVDLRLCSHYDARDTETTLKSTARREGVGISGALFLSNTFLFPDDDANPNIINPNIILQ